MGGCMPHCPGVGWWWGFAPLFPPMGPAGGGLHAPLHGGGLLGGFAPLFLPGDEAPGTALRGELQALLQGQGAGGTSGSHVASCVVGQARRERAPSFSASRCMGNGRQVFARGILHAWLRWGQELHRIWGAARVVVQRFACLVVPR